MKLENSPKSSTGVPKINLVKSLHVCCDIMKTEVKQQHKRSLFSLQQAKTQQHRTETSAFPCHIIFPSAVV